MMERFRKLDTDRRIECDLEALLHPAGAYAHPMDVVGDPDLTLNEKRAVLAAWASDACVHEAAPGLRTNAAGHSVPWDDIMDALRELDRQAASLSKTPPRYKQMLALRRSGRNLRTHVPGRSNDRSGLLN
jgi:hypothetical protein